MRPKSQYSLYACPSQKLKRSLQGFRGVLPNPTVSKFQQRRKKKTSHKSPRDHKLTR